MQKNMSFWQDTVVKWSASSQNQQNGMCAQWRLESEPPVGWLGRAMVLGSFQCWGVLLLWHIVGQGPAVLIAGAGWMAFFFFFFHLRLSYLSFSNASSFGRRLDGTEILWSRPLYTNGSCQLLLEMCSLSTGYPFRRSKPVQKQC